MLRADGGGRLLGDTRRSVLILAALATAMAGWAGLEARPAGQGAPAGEHLNPVVHRLAAGELVFGVSTYDLSLEHARSLARSDIDYVYVDMEHGPMDFAALQTFLLGMTDKQAIAASGSLRPRVAALARIAPYGRDDCHLVLGRFRQGVRAARRPLATQPGRRSRIAHDDGVC